uniref:Uncharacterized protein n=1 Tax=Castor canadensis TaxID=51338 RepID=A0A8C0WG60_CASCN
MGRRAWVPSPCPTSGLCPLLLLLLLLLLEPRGTQPQTGRCSQRLGSPAGSRSAMVAAWCTPVPRREVPTGSGVLLTTMTGIGPGATVWRP